MNVYTVCFYLSLTVLIGGWLLAKPAQRILHRYNHQVTRYVIIYLTVAAALFIAIFPIMDGLTALGRYLFNPLLETIRVLTATMEVPEFNTGVQIVSTEVYNAYLTFLYALAPLLTIGFIIRIFTNLFSGVKFYSTPWKESYVFSSLNEQTLIMGKDLYKKHKPREIELVYFNPPANTQADEWLAEEAKSLDALILPQSISEFQFGKRKGRVNIILDSQSEVENVTNAIDLIEDGRIRSCKKVDIYLFITVDEYDLLIDSYMKDNEDRMGERVRIICVDDLHNIASGLFNKVPLYKNLNRGQSINLIIFGESHLAVEFVKEASWMGQMLTHELNILSVSSKPEEVQKEISLSCPELNKSVEINFIRDDELNLEEFRPTYIIVANEDELGTLQKGVGLSAYFQKQELREKLKSPIICLWNGSNRLKDQILSLKDSDNNPYELIPFGNEDDRFSEENIFNTQLDRLGRKAHKIFGGSMEKYYLSEYSRKSSAASVLHNKYRIHDLKNLSDEGFEEDSEKLLKGLDGLRTEFERLEHRRWSAYMRSRGFQKLSLSDLGRALREGSMKNPVLPKARLHACLVEWEKSAGNPIEERGISYQTVALREIEELLNDPEMDDLDRITLTCWKLMKEGSVEEETDMMNNFKSQYNRVFQLMELYNETDNLFESEEITLS